MRFCQPHWDKLRAAIEAEGVADRIAPDGPEAAARFADAIGSGEETYENYDPLLWCHWAIIGRISEHAPHVLYQDGCPICWVQDDHEANCTLSGCPVTRQTFEDWIPGVAAASAERARRLQAAGG